MNNDTNRNDINNELGRYMATTRPGEPLQMYDCPRCGSAGTLYLDEIKNVCTCTNCRGTMTIFDMARYDTGGRATERREQLKHIHKVLGYPWEERLTATQLIANTLENRQKGISFFMQKGISEKTLAPFNVGYVEGQPLTDVDGVHVVTTGAALVYDGRMTVYGTMGDGQPQRIARYRHILFNETALDQNAVFIVTDELDALSVIEAGAQAVAVGTDTADLLAAVALRKRRNLRVPVLMLALQDETTNDALAADLDARGVAAEDGSIIMLTEPTANDALQAHRADFLETVQTIVEVVPAALLEEFNREQSAAGQLEEIRKKIANTRPPVKSNLKAFDDMLDGGFYEGLYVLGAVPAAGKTAFVLQISDAIAASGTDVLYFSLEMSSVELVSRSVSRETFLLSREEGHGERYALTERGVSAGYRYAKYNKEQMDVLERAFKRYEEYGQHIIINESVGEFSAEQVSAGIDKYVQLYHRRPVVVVDYLQALYPYNERMSDKQNVDRAMTELKRTSRRLGVAIILISSFGRKQYDTDAEFDSYKESGSIEYSASSALVLQARRDDAGNILQQTDPDGPRLLEIKGLKNRSYRSRSKVNLTYYPKYNYFETEPDMAEAPEELQHVQQVFELNVSNGEEVPADYLEGLNVD